ncbi:MAG TPA: muconolactone Delta-isomerase family protein [bacterium]|nr:muconolactone Delta-isomerase family protein [bacterium]
MRFLVTAEATGAVPNMTPPQVAQMLDTVVVPSLEMLAKWEREGRIHGGSFAGRRGGCMIIDAASNEELADLLMTLPFWGLQDWKITPLTSNEAAVKRVRDMSQRLKSVAGQR